MQIVNNLHAFIWQSPTANNCNAYFIDGPTRVLIDPGHRALFEHVERGLRELGLKNERYRSDHLHSCPPRPP